MMTNMGEFYKEAARRVENTAKINGMWDNMPDSSEISRAEKLEEIEELLIMAINDWVIDEHNKGIALVYQALKQVREMK